MSTPSGSSSKRSSHSRGQSSGGIDKPKSRRKASQAREGPSVRRTASTPAARDNNKKWTPTEEQTLIQLVNIHGRSPTSWATIARLSCRSTKSCSFYWRDKLEPRLHKNDPAERWNAPGEIQRLVDLVDSGQCNSGHGKTNWDEVQKAFGWGGVLDLRNKYCQAVAKASAGKK